MSGRKRKLVTSRVDWSSSSWAQMSRVRQSHGEVRATAQLIGVIHRLISPLA